MLIDLTVLKAKRKVATDRLFERGQNNNIHFTAIGLLLYTHVIVIRTREREYVVVCTAVNGNQINNQPTIILLSIPVTSYRSYLQLPLFKRII